MTTRFPINPAALPTVATRKALLIVDLQNDFVSPDGALYTEIPEGFVSRIIELAKVFRESNAGDVIWIRSEFEKHRPLTPEGDQILVSDTVHTRRPPARGRRPASRAHDESLLEIDEEAFLSVPTGSGKTPCVQKDSPGAEFAPEVQAAIVKGRDIVLTKTHYSAFAPGQQQLVQLLRLRFVTEMYICGALSNVSIFATAVDAGKHGYEMTLVDDCCGFRSELRHINATKKLTELTGSELISAEDLISTLQPDKKGSSEKGKQPEVASKTPVAVAGGKEVAQHDGTQVRTKERKESPVCSPGAQNSSTGLSPTISKMTLSRGGDDAAAAPEPAPPAPAGPQPAEPPEPNATQPQSPRAPVQPVVATRSKSKGAAPLEAQTQAEERSHLPDTGESSARDRRAKRLEAARLRLQAAQEANQSDDDSPAPLPPTRRQSGGAIANPQQEHTRVRVKARQRTRPAVEDGVDQSASVSSGLTSSSKPSTASPSRDKRPAEAAPEEQAKTEKEEEVSATMADSSKATTPTVSEPLCEGDTTIITNLLPADLADTAFERLLEEVGWASMSHLGGEVPRRIAVQGAVDDEGNMPVYRHPSDESPPLLPFSPTVLAIKSEIEAHLGHPLNHVLIQHYRTGNDYISEHSDKTIDVVRGSYIANVSLGAERTMTFRTKRPPKDKEKDKDKALSLGAENDTKRQIQRAALPHNSLCKMGLQTNMRWLHAIRQDKRSAREKTPAELAYSGARISLTFRQIGTFINASQSLIWGQGATSKTRESAREVINGQTPEAVRLLQAFGYENHASEFDWDEKYGEGFDVLHMGTPKRFCAGTGDVVANRRVALALAELGISCAKGSVEGEVRFEDNDPGRTTVDGHETVLRYLDAVYGSGRRYDQLLAGEVAKRMVRLQRALDLLALWRRDGGGGLKKEMEAWEAWLKEGEFVCGAQVSPADWAVWPVLHEIVEGAGKEALGGEAVSRYYAEFGKRGSVAKVLGTGTQA
ncbi:hypothetical protein OQA88_1161 [Cercophora sp. LCS_1]